MFFRTLTDEELLKYETVRELLNAEFLPGNYTPTKDQACELIVEAADASMRWAILRIKAALSK